MSLITDMQAIGKILQKAGNIELYEKLLTIQEKALETMEQNKNLREENSKLKEKLKIKDSLRFKENAYYTVDQEGNIKDGPFCSRCWDHNEKLICMHLSEKPRSIWCPKCKTYGGKK
jgi:regulator of replication initiation timing